MKRTLSRIWNSLVVLFMVLATMAIVPKVRGQFTSARATPDMIAVGYVGIGLLIGICLCAVSVTSFFWFRVPIWFRVLTALVIAGLAFGYSRASVLYDSAPLRFGSPVSEAELYTFFGTLAGFMLPLVFTGHGYPGLVQRLWQRSRTTNGVATDAD